MPEQQKVTQDFAISQFSLTLVLRKEDKQNSNMTWQKYKLNLRNPLLLKEYFLFMEQFNSTLSSVIDSTLGLWFRSFGNQYSEIIRSISWSVMRGCVHARSLRVILYYDNSLNFERFSTDLTLFPAINSEFWL